MRIFKDFKEALQWCRGLLKDSGYVVENQFWQSIETNRPTIEVLNTSFLVPLDNPIKWDDDIKPNKPWVERHLEERLSGIPYNPPPSHEIWPFAINKNKIHGGGDKFSHTYPERYWPKTLNGGMSGIRYDYGDCGNLIKLLGRDINTRQAYLPVFFPEDTGAASNQRIPCTLGYHFIQRNGYFHIVYYMRSCDYMRHIRDDIWLTVKLGHWILDRLKELYPEGWGGVKLGTFTMHITSLHIFKEDLKFI